MFSGNTARRLEESGGVTVRSWAEQQQHMASAGHELRGLASEVGQAAPRLPAGLQNQSKRATQIF